MSGIRKHAIARAACVVGLALVLAACGSSSQIEDGSGPLPPLRDETLDADLRPAMLQTQIRGCDFMEPAYCMFPWPNDFFTKADASTDTGRRINLNLLGMPKNLAGLPLRPDEWNRNDGFSPGQLLVTYVAGLDPVVSGIGSVADIGASMRPEAPILVIDADTGERHPIWVEIDASNTAQTLCDAPGSALGVLGLVAGEVGLEGPLETLLGFADTLGEGCTLTLQPVLAALGSLLHETLLPNNALKVDPPALLMRPGKNFKDGHRYIVAMRNLKNADGEIIDAPPGFRVYRDRYSSDLDAVNARRDHMEDIIKRLQRSGVKRDELYMAWDFTVASTRNIAGRLLHMRDAAFAELGDAAPTFKVEEVTNFESGESIRRVKGRFTVPNFLTLPDGICDNLLPPVSQNLIDYCAAINNVVSQISGTQVPGLGALLGAVADVSNLAIGFGQLPFSRLYYGIPGGELPEINPLQPTQEYRFQCEIPRTAVGSLDDADTWLRPATPTLYGHGLLGGQGEVGGGSTRRLRDQNFLHCAIDWIGMAARDVPSVVTFLIDMSNFPTLPDRAQQGMVNWHFLTRLLTHPNGFASDPAFQTADGRAVFDNSKVVYDGNSQGGIMGGVVVATSTEITRGSLGVPGMNYSTLLRRSVDFDAYAPVMYLAYPNSFDQSFIFSMIQMLWDRGETNGYANHLRKPDAFTALGHPTPDHEVMLNVAFGDHQVADVTADVMTRSFDGAVHLPGVEPGRSSNVEPYWGIRAAREGESGSVMVVWDIGPPNSDNPDNPGTETPPATNVPPFAGRDPHSDPRAEVAGGIQRRSFLVGDTFHNVCGPRPCFARGYVSTDVANRAIGNVAPVVSALGPVQARPGTTVAMSAVAADADRDVLTYSWDIASGIECVAAIGGSQEPKATVTLKESCSSGEVRVRIVVRDSRDATVSEIVPIRIQ